MSDDEVNLLRNMAGQVVAQFEHIAQFELGGRRVAVVMICGPVDQSGGMPEQITISNLADEDTLHVLKLVAKGWEEELAPDDPPLRFDA